MDLQMPVMDGLEASRIILHECSAQTRPHIVAMTANVLDSDRAACREAGMDDFLGKPVLLTELHKLLERSSVQVALRREGLTAHRPLATGLGPAPLSPPTGPAPAQ